MELNNLKLLLRKAVFTGGAFLKHTESIDNFIDNIDDKSLIEFFEKDNEAFELLHEWEAIREKLSEMASED